MQSHDLKSKTPQRKARRVGRGGKRGKTSGRGTKGQKARAGHKLRPELRDIIKKIPKLRGHGKNRARSVNSARRRPVVINVDKLSRFDAGDSVTPEILVERGLINKQGGRIPQVKILGEGVIERPLKFRGVLVSGSAKQKIEKSGGEVLR